jgi:transcriptional regulator of heat shock response
MVMDTLIHKTPITEFESLVWERHMNKELCKELSAQRHENGVLRSELDEVKSNIAMLIKTYKQDDKGRLVVKNREMKLLNSKKDAKIVKLKRVNDDLMHKCITLQREKEDQGLIDQNIDKSPA